MLVQRPGERSIRNLKGEYNMPMVKGKKYPYTKAGMKAAADAKKKKMMGGGMMKKKMMAYKKGGVAKKKT